MQKLIIDGLTNPLCENTCMLQCSGIKQYYHNTYRSILLLCLMFIDHKAENFDEITESVHRKPRLNALIRKLLLVRYTKILHALFFMSILFALLILWQFMIFEESHVHDDMYSDKNHIKIPSKPHSIINSSSLSLYQHYLLDKYQEHAYPLYSKPPFAFNHPQQPLNLVLIHKEKNEFDSSLYQRLLHLYWGEVHKIQEERLPVEAQGIGINSLTNELEHFVLIEGAPGVGKSTLCWQLCRLWSEGKLHHQWDLMVLVEIRDETTRKATSVYDLLYYPDDNIRESIAQEIQRQEGEGLLIIFDGYDELSVSQRRELSVFQQIFTNQLLRKATVMITSRPSATKSLPVQFKQSLGQHIEIEGFNQTDIEKYIILACNNNKKLLHDLKFYVFSKPFIFSLMYNPLHCSIITELYIRYWQDGRRGFAPNTLTELYTALVINLLIRNKNLSPSHSSNIEKLSDLPTDVYENLIQLAEVAASGLEESKYIYDNVTCDRLGLMVSVQQIYDIRPKRSTYMFLHLTLHEYMAAFYWSKQSPQQLASFIKRQSISSIEKNQKGITKHEELETAKYSRWSLLLFVAGFTKLEHFPYEEMNESLIATNLGSLCQALFEAKSSQLVAKIFSHKHIHVDHSHLLTPANWYVLGYCIANSDNTSKWSIYYRSPGLFKTMSFSAQRSNRDWTHGPEIEVHIYIQSTSFGRQMIFYTFSKKIYPFTKAITQLHLQFLDLSDCDEGISVLQNILHYCPRLKVLFLPLLKPSTWQKAPNFSKKTLIRIGLTLPQHRVIFESLHEYQTLQSLTLHTIFTR